MAVHSHQAAIRDAVTRLEEEHAVARQLCSRWFFGLGFAFDFVFGLRFLGLRFFGFGFVGLWWFVGLRFVFGLRFFGLWFFGFGFVFGLRFFGLWFVGLRFFGFGFVFGLWFFGLWFFDLWFRNGRLDKRRRRSGRRRCGGSLWVGRDSARLEGL